MLICFFACIDGYRLMSIVLVYVPFLFKNSLYNPANKYLLTKYLCSLYNSPVAKGGLFILQRKTAQIRLRRTLFRRQNI